MHEIPTSFDAASPRVSPAQPRSAAPPSSPGGKVDLEALLHRTFGHTGFRAHQKEVCEAATSGRDVLLVMPTGAGKSLCYQIPALARGGTALVISPLIALMDDQATKLAAAGLRVGRIHSGLSREDSRQVCRDYLSGTLDFLLIAPERLRVPGFAEMLAKRKPALVAIDEAHCISQWGHDFRPDYRTLGRHLPSLRPAPIIALTATATPSVQQDIVRQLELTEPAIFITGFRRTNLRVEAMELSKPERPAYVERLLKEDGARPAIVYAPSRKAAEELAARLQARFPAAAYHAGLEPSLRERVARNFLAGKLDVVVATVAFGMGVDKADVRTVVHIALPGSVEGYYQEIGRAGRDGLPSRTVLLHNFADRKTQEFLLEKSYPPRTDLERVAAALSDEFLLPEDLQQRTRLDRETLDRCLEKLLGQRVAEADPGGAIRRADLENDGWQKEYDAQVAARRAQLDRMVAFAEDPGCRMAALVRHFGDRTDAGQPCGRCDICQPAADGGGGMRQADTGERRNLRVILSALERGSRSTGQLFKELELTSDRRLFDRWIDALGRAGLLTVSAETFHTPDGREVGYRKAAITSEGRTPDEATMDTVWLRDEAGSGGKKRSSAKPSRSAAASSSRPPRGSGDADRSTWTDEQTALGERVRVWRKAQAEATGKPAFIVFGDRVLEQLVERQPKNLAELGEISGLGTAKIDAMGADLLALVRGEASPDSPPAAKKPAARPASAPQPASTRRTPEASSSRDASPQIRPGIRETIRPMTAPPKPVAVAAPVTLTPAQEARAERLRTWRKEQATAAGLPAFFVFSDTVLKLIAAAEPRTLADLRQLPGVGPDKVDRFGEAVLTVCQA